MGVGTAAAAAGAGAQSPGPGESSSVYGQRDFLIFHYHNCFACPWLRTCVTGVDPSPPAPTPSPAAHTQTH